MPFLISKSLSLRSPAARRRAWTLALLGFFGLLAGGCATGDIEMQATIAGGATIRVPLGRGGAVLTHEGGVQIQIANFMPNQEKKLLYVFAFTDERKRELRRVRVEDVSDETAVVLVDHADPKLLASGQWHGESEPMDLSDPRFGWLATISNTVRVFRFTLTFADGQTLVLHQGTLFSAAMKSAVRHTMGQNY